MIEVDYRFEEIQKLKFMVYDIDNATSSLDDDDFLGCLQCTLGEVSHGCYAYIPGLKCRGCELNNMKYESLPSPSQVSGTKHT